MALATSQGQSDDDDDGDGNDGDDGEDSEVVRMVRMVMMVTMVRIVRMVMIMVIMMVMMMMTLATDQVQSETSSFQFCPRRNHFVHKAHQNPEIKCYLFVFFFFWVPKML